MDCYANSSIFTLKVLSVANSDLIKAQQLYTGRLSHCGSCRTFRGKQGRAGELALVQGLLCPCKQHNLVVHTPWQGVSVLC